MNEDFDKVKKVIEAANDVAKINEAIRSEYNLQQKANSVYRSVYYKKDYIEFIAIEKIKQHMCGTLPFEKLRIEDKKAVLIMIRESIANYVLSIAKEELQKTYPCADILIEVCKLLRCTIDELKEIK